MKKMRRRGTLESVRSDRGLWTGYVLSNKYVGVTLKIPLNSDCFGKNHYVLLQRYPGQVILKSTRLRVAHTRRRERERSMEMSTVTEREECIQTQAQPLCLSTSVQTDPSSTLTTQPVTASKASLPLLPVPSPADSSCSPCSLSSLLSSPISPLPPPPPPPPLPSREKLSPSEKSGCHRQKSEAKSTADERLLSPLGPFIPRFFDSSQLLSARKKLRKTPEFDTHRKGNKTL